MHFKKLYNKILSNNIYFFKYVYKFSKAYVISQAIIAFIDGLLPLVYIIIPKLIIDELINGNDFNKIIKYIAIYFIIQVCSSIFKIYISQRYINLNSHLYAMHFLLLINKKILSLDMKQLDNPQTHQKLALAQDIIYKGIGVNLINNIFSSLSNIILIISTSLIIITADIKLLFIIIVFCVFSVFMNLKAENWRINQRNENIYLTRILNYYIKIIGDKSCAKEIRIFGFIDWLMNKYYNTLKSLKERLKTLYTTIMHINIVSSLAEYLKSNGIYLYLAWKTFNRQMTIGEFSQYFSATNQLSTSILNFVNFLTQFTVNSKYIDSFKEFMEMESDIELQNSNLLSLNKLKSIDSVINKGKLALRLENVSFAYPNSEENALQNINYTFEYGKSYVIVGENGVGKSTLINLLCRLYEPTSGTIYLNNIPINEFDYKEYKALFSIVFQDFKYFEFNISENITLNKQILDENEERVENCLNQAGLKNKIDKLPKGIKTPIGKTFYYDGIILSGGESQKLALARTLFREAPIIILDEPSSALDPISEDYLLNKFAQISKNKLIIYISHRLTCLNKADQIIYMKNKTIYESGTHSELMKSSKDYANYYNLQAKHYIV